MDTGILVAICILIVELIIILIVVGYIMNTARQRRQDKEKYEEQLKKDAEKNISPDRVSSHKSDSVVEEDEVEIIAVVESASTMENLPPALPKHAAVPEEEEEGEIKPSTAPTYENIPLTKQQLDMEENVEDELTDSKELVEEKADENTASVECKQEESEKPDESATQESFGNEAKPTKEKVDHKQQSEDTSTKDTAEQEDDTPIDMEQLKEVVAKMEAEKEPKEVAEVEKPPCTIPIDSCEIEKLPPSYQVIRSPELPPKEDQHDLDFPEPPSDFTSSPPQRKNDDDLKVIRRVENIQNIPKQKVLLVPEADESVPAENSDQAVAGVVNVTTGEKLTISQASIKGLVPRRTAVLMLEAQAATGSVVNPKNGLKMSVMDAVECGLIDLSFKQGLVAAEGAFYGFLDPRSQEQITLNEAIRRGIFPRPHGMRLLEFQIATGGVIDPWTGMHYELKTAKRRGLIDDQAYNDLCQVTSEGNFFEPSAQTCIGYADLLRKCVRDIDTGLKFLYIEERNPAGPNRYQPDLLTFRSAFRRKVTLQELIDAGLVEHRSLEALQQGLISKEDLRKTLDPYLIGEDPIAGILNKTTNKVMSVSQAVTEGLLRRNTALELLEAQAATGNIIDPITGKKMSVKRAAKEGLVLPQFVPALQRAEQAVSGYLDSVSGRTISLYEAIRKGVVIEIHGIRLLDAQFSTGGLIDPVAGYRIPPSVALERQLLDQRLAEVLTNTRNDMGLKGYYDPNSGENFTYSELMATCIRSRKHHSLPLLPLHQKSPVTYTFRSKSKHR